MTGLSGIFYEASLDDKLEQLILHEKMIGFGVETKLFLKERRGFYSHVFDYMCFNVIFNEGFEKLMHKSLISDV